VTLSKGINASPATLTWRRTEENICPYSGMCVTCLDGCIGLCEIGKSAVRGKEILYPQPFGRTTSASQKEYPVDYSYFNIMGTAVGAYGVEADPDKAIFPAVNLETVLGAKEDLKLSLPVVIAGMGFNQCCRQQLESPGRRSSGKRGGYCHRGKCFRHGP